MKRRSEFPGSYVSLFVVALFVALSVSPVTRADIPAVASVRVGANDTWKAVTNTGVGTKPINEIEAANANVAYAAYGNSDETGKVLKTRNYGQSWSSFDVDLDPTHTWYDNISVASSTCVWVGSETGWVSTTGNGGENWGVLSKGSTAWTYALEAVSTTEAWAGGHFNGEPGGFIYQTASAGASDWTLVLGIGEGTCMDIDSVGPTDAWAVGLGGYHGWIWHCSSGTWTPVTPSSSGYPQELYGVCGVNVDTAWAVGNGSQILKTTDGGSTWGPQTSPVTSTLRDVAALDADHAWAAGENGVIIKTTDGGETWVQQTSGTTSNLKSIFAVDATHVWACGEDGTMLQTTLPAPAPFISSLSPRSETTGSAIYINGSNFGDIQSTSYVRFGTTKAYIYSWVDNKIKAKVPSIISGLSSVKVVVGGVASNLRTFKVKPKISSISPTSGKRGSKLTINGTGFCPSKAGCCVKFTTTKAYIYAWSNAKIVVKVPSVSYGSHYVRVTTEGGTSTGKTFTVKR